MPTRSQISPKLFLPSVKDRRICIRVASPTFFNSHETCCANAMAGFPPCDAAELLSRLSCVGRHRFQVLPSIFTMQKHRLNGQFIVAAVFGVSQAEPTHEARGVDRHRRPRDRHTGPRDRRQRRRLARRRLHRNPQQKSCDGRRNSLGTCTQRQPANVAAVVDHFFLPPSGPGERPVTGENQDRDVLRQQAFARMKQGLHLGGPPYPKREELYDRFDG